MTLESRPLEAMGRSQVAPDLVPRRLFVHEPGWRVMLKVGNVREFCYNMAPGQDYYHRLLDGEIFLYHGDEKICLACGERRGLLSYEARTLREGMTPLDLNIDPSQIVDPIALEGGGPESD